MVVVRATTEPTLGYPHPPEPPLVVVKPLNPPGGGTPPELIRWWLNLEKPKGVPGWCP